MVKYAHRLLKVARKKKFKRVGWIIEAIGHDFWLHQDYDFLFTLYEFVHKLCFIFASVTRNNNNRKSNEEIRELL